jgi:hypothetical protein
MEKVGHALKSDSIVEKGQQKRAEVGNTDSYGSGNTGSYGSGNTGSYGSGNNDNNY